MIDSQARIERYRYLSFDAEGKPFVPEEKKTEAATKKSEANKPSEPEAAVPPVPSFSEQEMAQARQAAFQEGFRAAQQEAETKRNKTEEEHAVSMQALLDVIANRITLASEDHMQFLKSQQDAMLKVTLAIAKKIAGEALKREPLASVELLLKECAGLIYGNSRIVIAVAPQKSEGIRQSIDSIRSHLHDFQGELVVEQDTALAEHDCRIEWKNGHATRSIDAMWNEIESLLKKSTLIR